MNIDQLLLQPAWQIHEQVVAGNVSPVELVQSTLERIDRINPHINAFITLTPEQAQVEARVAERAVLNGEPLGRLHGLPIAVKDDIWTRGVRCTAGSLVYNEFIPREDSTCMRRLREAGAILVGKTNTPEFMCWSRTANKLMPETVNPWDIKRSAGASSGGSGAALAADLVPLAIGSDGGGSIRIPASLCGVVGMFPTPGASPIPEHSVAVRTQAWDQWPEVCVTLPIC